MEQGVQQHLIINTWIFLQWNVEWITLREINQYYPLTQIHVRVKRVQSAQIMIPNKLRKSFWFSEHLDFESWLIDYVPIFKTFFFFFRATPTAYGSSQSRDWIRVIAAGLCHSHSNARPESCLRPTLQLHSNTGSLTHWLIPGIELAP